MTFIHKLMMVMLLVGVCVFSVHVKNRSLQILNASKLAALPDGGQMPDFTLKDTVGREWNLKKTAANNTVLVINFWGTWCGPCRLEMPEMERIYKSQKGNKFIILAIDEGDDRAALDSYLKDRPVDFPVLIDPDGKFAQSLGIHVFPTSILVGHDGKIIQVIEGINPDWIESAISWRLSETRSNHE